MAGTPDDQPEGFSVPSTGTRLTVVVSAPGSGECRLAVSPR